HGDSMRGMTCNSFNSVSDNPPTVLVSIRQGTQTHDLVVSSGYFALSILRVAQQPLADRYAGMQGDAAQNHFDDVPHRLSPAGAPWLDGALGYLEARVIQTYDVGASTLFIGEVEAAEPGEEAASPLIRFRSAYTKL